MKTLIIIDSNQICYTAFYKTGNLFFKERPTGIIYGFLTELLKIGQQFKNEKYNIVFAWDSNRNWRKKHYTPYKRGREKKRKESGLKQIHFDQFNELRTDILPDIGFKNNFVVPGFEADDIIGKICLQNQVRKKIIVSSDNDLYQLLDIETSMYKPVAKKLYTVDNLFKEFGISKASNWIKVKAIAGCSTDKVKGTKGVGEKTAISFLTKKLNPNSKAYANITSKMGQRRYRRNLSLVTVPYPEKELKEFKIRKNKLSYDAFYSVCAELGFRSIIKEMKIWRKTFNFK